MTGWGQSGPLANAAGHDINYISVTGALAAIGPSGQAGAAAQPGRRLRRRRAVSRGRHSGGAAGGAKIRPGPGGRRRDVRRRGVADVAVLRADRDRALEGRPRIQSARRRRAFLRHLRMQGRRVHLAGLDRAAILCRTAPARRPRRRALRRPDGCEELAGDEGEDGRGVQDQDPRRMVRDHGRHRRLLRAGAVAVGSAKTSAHGGAQDFRRRRRHNAARAGATVFTHALGDQEDGGGGAWRRWRRSGRAGAKALVVAGRGAARQRLREAVRSRAGARH